MTILHRRTKVAIIPTYRRMCKLNIFLHLLMFIALHKYYLFTYSLLMERSKYEFLAHTICVHGYRKTIIVGKSLRVNFAFTLTVAICFLVVNFVTWLSIILLCSGDIHPNPGPSTTSSSDSLSSSSNMSDSIFNSLSLNHNLSFVHYNVQSIISKLEILHAELLQFDILAFTETWLGPVTDTNDLILDSYNIPERKDRVGDTHGGVMV